MGDFNMLDNRNIGYAKEAKVLGAIVGIDFLEDTVTLMDEDEKTHVVDIDTVVELEEVGSLDKQYLYMHDVIKVDERLFEIVPLGDGQIALHLLDDKFKKMPNGMGIGFERKQLSAFEGVAKFVGNVFELRDSVPSVDFDVAVFRANMFNGVNYFFAGNLKDLEKVILTKINFDDAYESFEYTYKQFLHLIEEGDYQEVRPNELSNYILGATYGHPEVTEFDVTEDVEPDSLFEDEDGEEEGRQAHNTCEDCGEHIDDCDCDLW